MKVTESRSIGLFVKILSWNKTLSSNIEGMDMAN